jgi:hypothetical protein
MAGRMRYLYIETKAVGYLAGVSAVVSVAGVTEHYVIHVSSRVAIGSLCCCIKFLMNRRSSEATNDPKKVAIDIEFRFHVSSRYRSQDNYKCMML